MKLYFFVGLLLMFEACQKNQDPIAHNEASSQRYTGPIIDMHLHAAFLEDFGGGAPICVNQGKMSLHGWDPASPISLDKLINCEVMIAASVNNEALMSESLAMLEKHNIYAVTFGPLERVTEWSAKSPRRIIPALAFTSSSTVDYSLSEYREIHKSGKLRVFAEITAQYLGKALNDSIYDAYWSLAQELDIPVGVHLGEGPPGGAHLMGGPEPSEYRVALGSPFQLEEVLIKYPKLRIYVMHYASPMVDEMIAMLYAHPQLYVDIAANNWGSPKAHFYSQLQRLINAGFEERILWGSDQMAWPQTIEIALNTIQEAPFLSKTQKKNILYANAVRFLRLSSEETEGHLK